MAFAIRFLLGGSNGGRRRAQLFQGLHHSRLDVFAEAVQLGIEDLLHVVKVPLARTVDEA